MRNGLLLQGAFVTPVLVLSSMAFACGAGHDGELACLPGMGIVVFHIGLLLPILAGVLERPFFTLAGMDREHLWLSIWLNCMAALLMNVAGLFAMAFAGSSSEESVIAWMACVVAGGAGLKYLWLRRYVALKGPLVSFLHLLAGSVVSAVTIASLPLLRQLLAPWSYSYRYTKAVQAFDVLIVLGVFVGCIVVYITAFCRSREITPPPPAERHGFDVVLRPVSTP